MVVAPELLSGLNAEKLRELVTDLIAQVARNDQAIQSIQLSLSISEYGPCSEMCECVMTTSGYLALRGRNMAPIS
jgi:hypothetical protein